MKTLGLIGGMSWESTAVYYRLLNERMREFRGGLHSAPLVLWSFDFAEIEALQQTGDWQRAAARMITAAAALQAAGADAIVICTNTMHRVADAVEAAVGLPVLHIVDATAMAIQASPARHPLLLATRHTMEQEFYTGRMRDRHGIDVRIPDANDRRAIHNIIYGDLCRGIVSPAAQRHCLAVIEQGCARGADSVILGCTELGLLLGQDDLKIPLFDSTQAHVDAALAFTLGQQ